VLELGKVLGKEYGLIARIGAVIEQRWGLRKEL